MKTAKEMREQADRKREKKVEKEFSKIKRHINRSLNKENSIYHGIQFTVKVDEVIISQLTNKLREYASELENIGYEVKISYQFSTLEINIKW